MILNLQKKKILNLQTSDYSQFHPLGSDEECVASGGSGELLELLRGDVLGELWVASGRDVQSVLVC